MSAIILKIQIIFFLFSLAFLAFLATKPCKKYKELSFQAQNFLEILKATVLETNRNSSKSKTKREK